MVDYQVDRSLISHFNPHKSSVLSLPDRRITRSTFKLNGIMIEDAVINMILTPIESPTPNRLIYEIVRLGKDGGQWDVAYQNELESHIKKESWSWTQIRTSDPDKLKKTVQMQVLCTEKRELNKIKPKKVRFVLRGDKQHPSTYTDTFSPTLSYDLLRIILADAVTNDREIVLLDIKTAYLNAKIDHEIYVELPRSMEEKPSDLKKGEKIIHRLQKAVYGLKQSGRKWYETLQSWLLSNGFQERGDIPCVLLKTDEQSGDTLLIIAFFVDDMIITGINKEVVNKFVNDLKSEYELKETEKDSNGYKDILGIKIKESRDKHTNELINMDLSLSSYIKDLIRNMGLEEEFKKTKPIKTPLEPGFQYDPEMDGTCTLSGNELAQRITWCREVVGALQYIAAALRPDIAYAANYMSRFVMNPHAKIIKQLKRILQYLYHTRERKIRYCKNESILESEEDRLVTYSDADYAGDHSTRKSTLGAIFMMNKGPIAWYARVARFAATSSTDAEVAALVEAGNSLSYYREVLSFLKVISSDYSKVEEVKKIDFTKEGGVSANLKPLIVYVDNTSAIALARKGTTGSRTKQMGVRVARAQDMIKNEHIIFKHMGTTDMLADLLTKPVSTKVMDCLIPKVLVDYKIYKNMEPDQSSGI